MKLFIKEHILLIIIQLVQFIVIAGVFWLAGFRNLPLIFYSIFLGLFFLFGYLVYKYLSRRHFYNRLTTKLISLDESQQELERAPISEALSQLLKSQYYLYENEMMQLKNKQEEHFIFMDRWIHQMKTPLSVIELMAQDLDEPDSSDMREETDRIKSGLNTVLYMGRLRTMSRDFHVKLVDLKSMINEVNKENKRFFIRNHVYPQVEVDSEGLAVETDDKWLHFMITQLVQNAVKYSAKKSEQILLKVYKRNAQTILEIEDFGIGIPQSDMKRIFDPFFTGENGRKYRESTGVGLYLVKEVAQYLGHRIEVDSEVGKGSVFRIVFS